MNNNPIALQLLFVWPWPVSDLSNETNSGMTEQQVEHAVRGYNRMQTGSSATGRAEAILMAKADV